jgi:glycosyltransferase involved in cell wall biosynthesis
LPHNSVIRVFPVAFGEPRLDPLVKPKILISIVIPALNEAARIRDAVEALAWADEVIVADGGSQDSTIELAREAGAKVLDARGGTIASQRNAGIAAARNSWVLALDVDERVPSELSAEIALMLAEPMHEAYRIRFRNFYLGHELRHGRWGREWHVRLFQANRRFFDRRVHEHLEPVADIGTLVAPIEHSPYRDLTHHLQKMVRYSEWAAEDLSLRGRRSSFAHLTVHPAWRFLREYIVYSGWRDGRAGLMVAALSACSALLKYAHLQALDWQTAPTRAWIPRPPQPIAIEKRQKARLISSEF